MRPVAATFRNLHHRAFLLFFFLMLSSVSPACATARVMNGIDVLAARGFDILQGKRIGLITNHTGLSSDGRRSIDILYHAPGVRLTALFSPEHGIRGTEDDKLAATVDTATGLPVHSLYGTTCSPTPAMLRGVDMLLFDIQDIGTRFYTYIGTLSLAMEAAGKAGIPFVVLDRPNPIGGIAVSGAIPHESSHGRKRGCGALTSIHRIPTRHGMTVGELARLFNTGFDVTCDLTVIQIQGWRREMYFDQTGLPWINPSPNMKSLDAALLYPGFGILETTNLSVGRGTEQPFQLFGAPWVDAEALLSNLSRRNIPGLEFSVCSFIPTATGHPYKGKLCRGIRVAISNREAFDPILAGLHLLQAFYETHPGQLRSSPGFVTEVGDKYAWELLTLRRATPDTVAGRWNSGLEAFKRLRERYLIY